MTNDVCKAVVIAGVAAARAESCKNEIKDKCCYLCHVKDSSETSCDLLDTRDSRALQATNSKEEIKQLLSVGFEYVCQKDDLLYFRKRK